MAVLILTFSSLNLRVATLFVKISQWVMLNETKQNQNKKPSKTAGSYLWEPRTAFSSFSSPSNDLRASLKKIGERQCLKWYALLCSTCFTEVLFLGLCHLQMPLYLLSVGKSSPFGSWFMFSIFKIWWSGIFAHFFSFQSPNSCLQSPYVRIYTLLFLSPLHPCTHQGPQCQSAAQHAYSLLCKGGGTLYLQHLLARCDVR